MTSAKLLDLFTPSPLLRNQSYLMSLYADPPFPHPRADIICACPPTLLLFQSSNPFFFPLWEAAFILTHGLLTDLHLFSPSVPLSKLIKAHR